MAINLYGAEKSRRLWYRPLLRVPPGATVRVTVCSAEVIALATHWTTRQVLCPGEDCPLCVSQSPRVQLYVLGSVAMPHSSRVYLLELPASAVLSRQRSLLEQDDSFELGTVAVLSRRAKRSPLVVCFEEPVEVSGSSVCQHPKLVNAIAALYRLPTCDGGTVASWAEAVRPGLLAQAQAASLVV